MFRTILILSILIGQVHAFAQGTLTNKMYSFAHYSNQPYQSIENTATLVVLPVNWDDTVSSYISLPLNFFYQNLRIDSIAIHTNGSLILNNKSVGYLDEGQIFGLRLDYESKNRAKIYHQVDGISPNRTFKVEFYNMGLLDDATGSDSVSFQIWLNEVDSSIEFHIGPNNIPNSRIAKTAYEFAFQNKYAPFLGIVNNAGDSLESDFEKVYFHHATNTNGSFVDSFIKMSKLVEDVTAATYVNASLKRMPAQGEVFVFKHDETVNVGALELHTILKVFPNPCLDNTLTISGFKGITPFAIYNSVGSKILDGDMIGDKIDITALSKGLYYIILLDKDSTYYSKIEKL